MIETATRKPRTAKSARPSSARPANSVGRFAAALVSAACGELVYLNAVPLGDGRTLIPRRPVLYIADRSAAGYAIRDRRMELDVFAESIPALTAEVKSEMAFLWREYAESEDSALTADALALKRNLIDLFEVLPAAIHV